MATFFKFNAFVEHLAEKVHDLSADTLKIYLTNAAPDAALDVVKTDLAEIAAGNGYTAGGITVGNKTSAQTAGTYKLASTDNPAWTAAGGTIGPFRYAVLYNDTPTSPVDPLIGAWDYGSSITLQIGETFTVDLDAANGILTIA
jgi:hypothetical protein